MSRPTVLNSSQSFTFFSTSPISLSAPGKIGQPQTLKLFRKVTLLSSISASFSYQSTVSHQNDDDLDFQEERVIGDCVVYEDGVFENSYLQNDVSFTKPKPEVNSKSKRKKRIAEETQAENLVPDKWREVQAELNITKKDRRKLAYELEFGRRVERKKQGLVPLRNVNLDEYLVYKEAKLRQLKPVVLDNPSTFPEKEEIEEVEQRRVAPKNPRWAVYGKGFEDVAEFFNSGQYDPSEKKSEGPRKLFTKDEKVLLNRRIPDVATASSGKWLPLHTLAASGEFYLMDALLKHNVDINAEDKDGWTALHKAIICKKQAITNYLLRESANPFIRDKEGATLMHYAVQTASSQTIKILLLYNVDINLLDNDGWTPLHLAVQARRTDLVRLLLIKGADKTLKNQDGLTPLDLCLYSGRDTRTYELIKLLKQLPKSKARRLL